MSDLHILPASLADAGKILQVLEAVYAVSPWSLAQIETDLASPQLHYWLARAGSQVLGFLAVQETDFEAEILQIAVQPAYQGQGIASRLFEQLPAGKDLFLEVRVSNQAAQLFYKKQAFKEIAVRKGYYHDPSEDAVIMKREINER